MNDNWIRQMMSKLEVFIREDIFIFIVRFKKQL